VRVLVLLRGVGLTSLAVVATNMLVQGLMQVYLDMGIKRWGSMDGQIVFAYAGAASISIVLGLVVGILWTFVTAKSRFLVRKTVYLYVGLLVMVAIIGALTDLWAGTFPATFMVMTFSWLFLILSAEMLVSAPIYFFGSAGTLLIPVVGAGVAVMVLALAILWIRDLRAPVQEV